MSQPHRNDAELDARYRAISLWHDTAPEPWYARTSLPADRDADVVIVGAGYTGLWTAYYLTELDPSLRIVVLESEVAGFGASGRNGGWCSSIFPASWRRVARDAGRDGMHRLQRALDHSVDEVGSAAAREGLDVHFTKGGYVSAARNAAQWQRARAEVDDARQWGFGEETISLLSASEVAARVGASGVLGGTFMPNCAVLHPTRLVRGLADVVERRGVSIYERTAAVELLSRRVITAHGTVTADVVVLATEGYTPEVFGHHRDVVPVYSLMVATEPLSDEQVASVGLAARQTFSDKRHLRIYGQRTADGRIAFGGRGAPYHFGSRVRASYDREPSVHDMLRDILRDLLPGLRDVTFTHEWGGNLGVPRDWYPSVRYDASTGFAWAGGYVGDGVSTTNLAGRTLADLITGRTTELTELPWAQRRSRRWEPEPFRWLGVNSVTQLMSAADRREAATGKPSRSAAAFWRAIGH